MATIHLYWVILADIITIVTKSHPLTQHEEPCIYEKERKHLTCKRYFPSLNESSYHLNVTEVQLNQMVECCDNNILDFHYLETVFPNLESFSMSGEISDTQGKNNGISIMGPNNIIKLKKLQIISLSLNSVDDDFFEKLPYLEVLDLRHNKLQKINLTTLKHLKTVYLSGNRWNCSEDLDWIINPNISSAIMDIKNLTCYQFPYPGKPLKYIAKFLLDVKTNCTDTCDCRLIKVVQNPSSDKFEPIVEVNCSYRGFTELPSKFPRATKTLHLEGNSISDLRPLKNNVLYRGLMDIYLDNNSVSSIRALEGSYWLTHLRIFSLTGNKLTELPSYALDNALQQNTNMPNAVSIALGGNPWRCDCAFTPAFQDLLRKYSNQFKDLRSIKCSYVEGDENSLLPILELSRSSVCRLPSEYSVQEALDLLNGILGFLIIFVLGKLAYDYYYFKKTGRLPWIVTKMP